MLDHVSPNVEPVPTASQLAILPFLGAVEGSTHRRERSFGIALDHSQEVMTRAGQGYLQQACAYLGPNDANWRDKVGRTFALTYEIIGAAYHDNCIWRTKQYPGLDALQADLLGDVAANGETVDIQKIGISYLAIPLLSPADKAVLVFYAECRELNFFSDDQRLRQLLSMCKGLCRLLDWLQEDPPSNIRNAPLQQGIPFVDRATVYRTIQEQWRQATPPKFDRMFSFNFEGPTRRRRT